jgi:hypothetical protein
MRLPHKLPLSQQDRETLGKFYDAFKKSPWFDLAELIDTTKPKTLEVHLNSNSPEVKGLVQAFADATGLKLKLIVPQQPMYVTNTGEEAIAFFDKATAITSHYCVILVFPKGGNGSGTLVSCHGLYGILTANHVAQLLDITKGDFMLCARQTPDSITIRSNQYRHVVVGKHHSNRGLLGPDLSFIEIIDPELLSRLKGAKSFHPLEENLIPPFEAEQLKEMVWIVSGAPDESKEPGTLREKPLTTYTLSHMAVQYHSVRHRNGFDYFRMRTTHGADGYPKEYGGVSGGGLWVLGMNPDTHETEGILQGVIYYHYRLSKKSTDSILIAHGVNSIYECLVKAVSHNSAWAT